MNLLRNCPARLLVLILWGLAGKVPAQPSLPEATNLWVLKLSDHVCSSSPALAPDGTIYQATFDGTLLAVYPQGKLRWTFNTGAETDIKSSPAIADDGTIYFGSRNRKFYAVSPEGKLKWTFLTGAWVDSSPAIAQDGTIYFGGWDGNFYALDPAGRQKWKFTVGAVVVSSPAIGADGTIYFGALDQKLYALRPDGSVKWTFAAPGEITSSPAIGADGAIYFTALDGNLYALEPAGGERWRFHSGGVTECSPVLDEHGNIYVAGDCSEGVYGEMVVSHDGHGRSASGLACLVDGSALAVTGRVYWARPWRTLQAFHADGECLWEAGTAANVSSSPVAGADGTVYVTAQNVLYAFEPPGGGVPLARSPWPMFRANPRHTGRVGN